LKGGNPWKRRRGVKRKTDDQEVDMISQTNTVQIKEVIRIRELVKTHGGPLNAPAHPQLQALAKTG